MEDFKLTMHTGQNTLSFIGRIGRKVEGLVKLKDINKPYGQNNQDLKHTHHKNYNLGSPLDYLGRNQ